MTYTGPVRGAQPSTAVGSLRLVTYNIHKGIGGVDRRYRLERTIAVLEHCQGDIVFLQEVDEGARRSRFDRQVDVLGDALGLDHRAFYPNHRLRRGHYGNAILSRFPLDHTENIDLTQPLKKRRSAVHARLTLAKTDGRVRLWLFNVHLGLAEYERRRQLRRIVDWQIEHRRHHDTAVVIAGDFNDVWGRLGRTVLEPEGYVGTSRAIRTFPAIGPLRPLDRAFVSASLRIANAYRSRLERARHASDHLPLVVDLVI